MSGKGIAVEGIEPVGERETDWGRPLGVVPSPGEFIYPNERYANKRKEGEQ
jgi:hypothetical protein